MHDPLKLRAVDQIEGALLAWEHFESYFPGRGDHSGGLFGSKVSPGNRVKREAYQDPQAPDAPAFFVNFRLRGRRFCGAIRYFHIWPVGGPSVSMN